MSRLKELLKNEKVEWKKLGEVSQIKTESAPKKIKKQGYLTDGKYPIIDQGQEFIVGYTNDETAVFPKDKYIIFGDHTENIKYVDFLFAQGADGIKVLKTDNNYLDSKYLYYAIVNSYIKTGKYKRHFSQLKETFIPIPSLETQKEIVKTLDKFTNYVTELQGELQARNKQYTYYRDKLLNEDTLNKLSAKLDNFEKNNKISWTELQNIIKIKNGKDWKKLEKGNIPVYGSGGHMGVYVDISAYNKPTVLIPRKGSINNIFYLDQPFWNVDTVFYTEIDETKILPKYFYYFMSNYDLTSLSENSTRPSLTQSRLNKIKIGLPPIEIQEKVVKILDEFQNLIADVNGALPKEIEERQKQYEYYREKLLNFGIEIARERERA